MTFAASTNVALWQHVAVPTLNELVESAIDRLEASSGQKFKVRPFEEQHGISNGTIAKIRKGVRRSLDPATTQKLAQAFDLPLAELLAAMTTGGSRAEVASSEDPPSTSSPEPTPEPTPEPPQRVVVRDDRYANRGIAAKSARELGVDEYAITLVEAEAHDSDEDPPPLWWLDRMRSRADELRYRRKDPGAEEKRRQLAVEAAEREAKEPTYEEHRAAVLAKRKKELEEKAAAEMEPPDSDQKIHKAHRS